MKKPALIALLLTVVLAFGSITASAMDMWFGIDKLSGVVWVASNTKDLSGSVWKISNEDTSWSDFVPGYHVIGFKTKNPDATISYSGYHTFSQFVYRYSLPYTTTPSMGASLRLNAQLDSSSIYGSLNYDGEWIS